MNKKGAEMTVSTIIIIVLALIVLVVLVVGFTGGWSNLWGRITSFFGSNNIDSVVQACATSCTMGNKYDFCDRERTIKAETEIFQVDKTTKKLVQTGGDVVPFKEAIASCKVLADLKPELGFQKCETLC